MKHWKTVRLDKCCEIVAGATPSSTEPSYWGGAVNWVTPKDLSNLPGVHISETPRKLTDAGLKSCAATLLPVGSVLFSSRAPIGHVAINTVPMATNQGFKSFVPKADLVQAEFLYWWLRFNRAYLESLGNGATFKEVSKTIVSRVEISLPPLTEQRRIAAILNQAETLRTQRRAALVQLDSLTQSIFLDMFGDPNRNEKGWRVVALESISDAIWDIDHKMPKSVDDGMPFISAKDLIEGGVISFSDIKLISREDFKHLSKKGIPQKGDIIYSRIGVNLGKARMVEVDFPFLASYSCCTIRPNESLIDRQYLCHLLDSPYLLKQAHRGIRGIAVPDLGMGEIRNFQIILPPLTLQRAFATRIQAIETLKTTHRAAVAELDALFASLQQRAFSGELTRSPSVVQVLHTKARDFGELCKLDAEKGLEALIYVARRMPEQHFYKSLKALYFADKHQLEHSGRLIYGETHCALPMGPVPQAAYDAARVLSGELLVSAFDDQALRASLRRTDKELIPLRDADPAKLSAEERASLDWAIRYVAPMSFDQVKTASHDSAYERTPRNQPVQLEHIIEMLPEAAKRRFFAKT